MDLFDTLIWAEILVKTTFFNTPTLTVLTYKFLQDSNLFKYYYAPKQFFIPPWAA
jgi:hypothetical protein